MQRTRKWGRWDGPGYREGGKRIAMVEDGDPRPAIGPRRPPHRRGIRREPSHLGDLPSVASRRPAAAPARMTDASREDASVDSSRPIPMPSARLPRASLAPRSSRRRAPGCARTGGPLRPGHRRRAVPPIRPEPLRSIGALYVHRCHYCTYTCQLVKGFLKTVPSDVRGCRLSASTSMMCQVGSLPAPCHPLPRGRPRSRRISPASECIQHEEMLR